MGNPPYFSPVSCDTSLVVPIIVWQRICSYHLYFDVEDSGSQIIDYLIGSVLSTHNWVKHSLCLYRMILITTFWNRCFHSHLADEDLRGKDIVLASWGAKVRTLVCLTIKPKS